MPTRLLQRYKRAAIASLMMILLLPVQGFSIMAPDEGNKTPKLPMPEINWPKWPKPKVPDVERLAPPRPNDDGSSVEEPSSAAPSALTMGRQQIYDYLKGKYGQQQVRDVTSVERESSTYPGAMEKSVSIHGPITPTKSIAFHGDPQEYARDITLAFFSEEAQLFGLTPMTEMKTVPGYRGIHGPDTLGYVAMRFHHYLAGIRLDWAETIINVNSRNQISYADVDISPIPPELLHAVTQPTLSEKKIRTLIKQDLISFGLNWKGVVGLTLEKVAVPIPPYVVWKAKLDGGAGVGSWDYTFDAVTGTLLERKPSPVMS